MPNAVTRHISNELYMAAGVLVLFGFARASVGGPSRPIQLILAVACAGAAVIVRQGGPTGRIAGFAAAGATVAFGAFCLWTGRGFMPGSIISVYALVQLFGSEVAFSVAQQSSAAVPQQVRQQVNPSQFPSGVHVVRAEPAYGQQWTQPAPAAWPPAAPQQQWSPAELQHYFAPPAGQVPPPPPPPLANR